MKFNPFLIIRTLAPLRWEQLAYRPLRIAQYRLYRQFPKLASRWGEGETPTVDSKTVEKIRSVFKRTFAHYRAPFEHDLERSLKREFRFLNHSLRFEEIDWNRRYESHLWNYHLHYFDYALWWARALSEGGDQNALRPGQRLIESWIEEARIGRSDGWDGYPVSLRVVNWIYGYALIADGYHDREFLSRWLASIHRQLDFLRDHLELHLLANHLLKNIKALVIGGLFFDRREWQVEGERRLWREFDEQVLEDGGHYERSPMYHAQALADFLECYALLRAFNRQLPARVEAGLRRMAGFLEAMSYPEGSLALFNDSANTEETKPLPIIESAAMICGYRKKSYPSEFGSAGYYLWSSDDEKEKVIVDAGPPSVDYNPAHAHCDMLSYELRIDGQPFIVDPGVHGYGGDRFREYCRSTRAHNTVVFDRREQSEIWSTFRMARRAELIGAEARGESQTWNFRGSYRPYYDRRMVHERRIRRDAGGDWVIEDRAVGGRFRWAESFIHLHPQVEVHADDRHGPGVECRVGGSRVVIEPFNNNGPSDIVRDDEATQGWYFPDFGVAQPSRVVCFRYRVKAAGPFGYRIYKR